MTEKKKPTYDLETFKATCSDQSKLSITRTAFSSADKLKMGRSEIVAILKTMERHHFYKSMTSNNDYKQWQDVYHVPSVLGVLYIKFTGHVVTMFTLLSFKRKDDE